MNRLIPIVLLLCTTALTHAESTEEIWKNLAVHSQNLAYKFQIMGGYSSEEGSRDIHHYTNELAAVENDLQALVKQKVLTEETLELSEAEIDTLWQDDEYQELMGELFDRYGGYTARELLDIGTRLNLQNTNMPIHAHIRLPENELHQFKTIVGRLFEEAPDNQKTSADNSKNIRELWKNLSIRSQNLSCLFMLKGGFQNDGLLDYALCKEGIEAVDQAIQALVDADELTSEILTFPVDDYNRMVKTAEFKNFTTELSQTYGTYVGLDLIDMGTRSYFMAASDEISFRVRLPEKQLKQFKSIAEKHLLKNPPNNSNAPKE